MTHSLELLRRVRNPRHLRSVNGFLAFLLMFSLSACGGQSVSLVASKYKVGPADTITLSGAFSDEKAGLEVELQSSTGSSAFEPTGQATTTDRSGAYTFSYKPSSPGKTNLRVVLVNGAKPVVTRELVITVLEATAIKSHLSGRPKWVSERETPSSAPSRRQNEAVWCRSKHRPMERPGLRSVAAVTTDSDGSFTLGAPTTGAGAMKVRPTVSETQTHEAASGAPMKLFVSDYKAAGAQYLSCVYTANKAGEASNAAISKYDAGEISWSALKKTNKVYAQGVAEQIRCLKNYSWPPSVAGLVRDLAQQAAVVLDATMTAISAKTSASYFAAFGAEFRKAEEAGGSDAEKIRRKLGLPESAG